MVIATRRTSFDSFPTEADILCVSQCNAQYIIYMLEFH